MQKISVLVLPVISMNLNDGRLDGTRMLLTSALDLKRSSLRQEKRSLSGGL